MIHFQNIYHTGIVVDDLARARTFYARTWQIDWTSVQVVDPMRLWTPEEGLREFVLHACYSRQGPHHIELVQAIPGTFFDVRTLPDVKHTGVWVDDVAVEVEAMTKLGWTVLASADTPEQGYGAITHMLSPKGSWMVELVSTALRPMLADWFAAPDSDPPKLD